MGRVNQFFNMGKISFNLERTATVFFPRFFAVAVGSRLNERKIDRPCGAGARKGRCVLRRIRKGGEEKGGKGVRNVSGTISGVQTDRNARNKGS